MIISYILWPLEWNEQQHNIGLENDCNLGWINTFGFIMQVTQVPSHNVCDVTTWTWWGQLRAIVTSQTVWCRRDAEPWNGLWWTLSAWKRTNRYLTCPCLSTKTHFLGWNKFFSSSIFSSYTLNLLCLGIQICLLFDDHSVVYTLRMTSNIFVKC